MANIRTQVIIVGGGPAGLLLSQLLDLAGIESVVIEQRSKDYVMSRIRAGVIEHGSAAILRGAEVGERMDAEGIEHDGTMIAVDREPFRVDFRELTGKTVTIYGQTELTKDLYAARAARGGIVIDEAEDVQLDGIDTESPSASFHKGDEYFRVTGRFIAGCDGYHGVSRTAFPANDLRTYELVYPFGWLGILSETPPVSTN